MKKKWLLTAFLFCSVAFAQDQSSVANNENPNASSMAAFSAPIPAPSASAAAPASTDSTAMNSTAAAPVNTTSATDASAASAPLPGATYVDDGTQNPSSSPDDNSMAGQQVASSDALGTTSTGREAFAHMVRNLMPLSPTQIVTLRNMFNQSQKAVAQYPGVPPKPTSSSILVNMSPGSTPPVIRLREGYVTSLVFLDSSGQPWPVVGYDLGNPKAFNIQPSTPNGKSDMLIIQALDRYEQGNLAVMLKDQDTPVMLTLIPGQRAVDYRVDLRMPELGPNAVATINGLPNAANPLLMNFLDGVPPEGAQSRVVEGAPAQAWVFMGHLFLRTRVSVLSPGWIQSMSSPDGTHVYELTKTPVILASQRGQMVRLWIKGLS